MSTVSIAHPADAAGSTLARDLRLVGAQIRYEQRAYWRNRSRGVFTFVFPLMFLAIFASLDSGQHISSLGGIPYDDFLVPGILAYAVITTTFTNLAIATAILRDRGVLKRMQGTPLPTWAYVAARIGSTWIVTAIMAVVVIVAGALIWGLRFGIDEVPGVVLTLTLGAAAFTSIGIGMTRLIKTAESGPIVVNLIVFPLSFISNIWFPTDGLPPALRTIAGLFPMKALAAGLQHTFDPRRGGVAIDGHALATLAAWTAIGVWLMVGFLRRPAGEDA